MSRRTNNRKSSSGTPSSGDSFERRIPPSRKGGKPTTAHSDDGMFAFLEASNAGAATSKSVGGGSNGNNKGLRKNSSARPGAMSLKPAPIKPFVTLKRKNQQHAPQPSALDVARETQRRDGRDYSSSRSSSVSFNRLETTTTTSTTVATRTRSASSDRRPQPRKRIGLSMKSANSEGRESQPPDDDERRLRNKNDDKTVGLLNRLVSGALQDDGGSSRSRDDDNVQDVIWYDAAEAEDHSQDNNSRDKCTGMKSLNDRIPKKRRSESSADEVVNVCASADEETETEQDGTPDIRLEKKKKKDARSLQRGTQPKRSETISIEGNSDDDDANKKRHPKSNLFHVKIPPLPLHTRPDLRKDTSETIGKTRRSKNQLTNPKKLTDDSECSVVENPMPHKGQTTRNKKTASQDTGRPTKRENHSKSSFQRSNVCNLSESDNEMSQNMMDTDDNSNNNNNNNDSDQALANDLSGLHVQGNTDGSNGKKRKRKDGSGRGLHDDATEDGGGNDRNSNDMGYDSEVELVDTPQKQQPAANVQQALSSIEKSGVFVRETLKLHKAVDTSETQGISPDELGRRTSSLDRGMDLVKKSGKAMINGATKFGTSLRSMAAKKKKLNGRKEPTRIQKGEAIYAYYRDQQQQEEEERNDRDRKRAHKQKSSSSGYARKQEASCSSDEKENETLVSARRRSARLQSTPRKNYMTTIWSRYDTDEEYEGDEDLGFAETAQKRKKRSKKPEVIEVDDSDDEKEAEPIAASTGFDLSRIAIGSMVFDHSCAISWVGNKLELSYSRSGRSKRSNPKTTSHIIDYEKEITLVKYFVPPDGNDPLEDSDKASCDDDTDQTCFIALCVSKSGANSLMSISNKYKPDANNNDDGKKYIVAEFRSDVAWQDFVENAPKSFKPYFADSKLSPCHTALYTKSLTDHSKKQVSSSQRSPGSSGRSGSLAKMNEHDVLVVYPFGAKMSDIEATSEGLRELSGASLIDNGRSNEIGDPSNTTSEAEGSGDGSDAIEDNKPSRAHCLTVRVGDYDRLEAGEFLNDTLIDVFLQWMVRHDDRSSIHIFSSHFYTTLLDEGPNGVAKWTKNKGIDVFSRKLIFIPINRSLHWSLCVVINPGHIKILHEQDGDRSCQPMPCLLFLDSLRAHQKSQVRRKVTSWLNSEWERLGKDPELKFPFKAMNILSPRVPYQDNTWDCGVFACRYAYSVYQLRDRVFSFEEMNLVHGEIDMITNGPEFDFEMDDIARIRLEMKTWLENLHRVYKHWKKKADEDEAKEKTEKRRAQQQAQKLQESQDSSTVEVVGKKAQPLNNESDDGNKDEEELKVSEEKRTHFETTTPTQVQAMEIDLPETPSGKNHVADSSDDEVAAKQSSLKPLDVHDFPLDKSPACSPDEKDEFDDI